MKQNVSTSSTQTTTSSSMCKCCVISENLLQYFGQISTSHRNFPARFESRMNHVKTINWIAADVIKCLLNKNERARNISNVNSKCSPRRNDNENRYYYAKMLEDVPGRLCQCA